MKNIFILLTAIFFIAAPSLVSYEYDDIGYPGLSSDTEITDVNNLDTNFETPKSDVSCSVSNTDNYNADEFSTKCCKICVKGKACGNTCIARDKTCHVGKGCACNG